MVAKIKSSKPNLLFGKLGQIPKRKKKGNANSSFEQEERIFHGLVPRRELLSVPVKMETTLAK